MLIVMFASGIAHLNTTWLLNDRRQMELHERNDCCDGRKHTRQL